MYEIMWDTREFNKEEWEPGQQPFVYSMGDA
jgi:hypothetical protein